MPPKDGGFLIPNGDSLNRLFQVRDRRAATTSGIAGHVGPTNNDAGDQSQREDQISDPNLVA
jgi:hypothetical protein